MIDDGWWMMDDDGWWMMDDGWWWMMMMDDDGWCMIDDGWWMMMDDGWCWISGELRQGSETSESPQRSLNENNQNGALNINTNYLLINKPSFLWHQSSIRQYLSNYITPNGGELFLNRWLDQINSVLFAIQFNTTTSA